MKRWKLWLFMASLLILVSGCGKKDDLQSFQDLVYRFDEATQKVKNDNEELGKIVGMLVKHYPDSINRILTKLDSSLSPEEYELLEQLIREEKDLSLKSQLNRIITLQKELAEAREEIQKLRYVLPLPMEAKKGDTHYDLCMKYLQTNHNLSPEDARKLVEKVGLFEPLVPGFFVWNYYKDGVFGSFVTQGNAPVTPMQVYRKNKEYVNNLIKSAQSSRDSAMLALDELRILKEQLEEELGQSYDQLKQTRQKIDSLSKLQEQIFQSMNSLLVYVNLESVLKEEGILSGGLFRKTDLKNMPPLEKFELLDLRYQDGIKIKAADFQLNSLRKVVVYPKSFKMDIDYQLIFDDSKEEVYILLKRPSRFKQQKIVVAVN